MERFHRTLKRELLQEQSFADLAAAQSSFDPWRWMYNHERPHESLDLEVPASRYRSSDRAFQERTSPFEYDERFTVRSVSLRGTISFHGVIYSVSESFRKERIGLNPTATDGVWDVYYCRFRIGQLDDRGPGFRRCSFME